MAGWRSKRRYKTDEPNIPIRFSKRKRREQAAKIRKKVNKVNERRKRIDFKKIAIWTFQILATVLIAFVCVYYFGVRVASLDNAMNPQIRNQQSVLVNRVVYNATRPDRGDVIVFHPKGNEQDRYYIRRIIGMPGETIQIKKGKVYIDGKRLEADYLPNSYFDAGLAADKIKIPKDSYFVISDNQYNLEDSRSSNIGNVNHASIYGKAWFVPTISRQFGFVK